MIKKLLVVIFSTLVSVSNINFAAAELDRSKEIQKVVIGAVRDEDLGALGSLVVELGGINAPYDKELRYTCLMEAAGRGKKRVVDWCIMNGADFDVQDKRGDTALMRSLYKEKLQDKLSPADWFVCFCDKGSICYGAVILWG